MLGIRHFEIHNSNGDVVALFIVRNADAGEALLDVSLKLLPTICQKMESMNTRDGYPNSQITVGSEDPEVITFLIKHRYNFNCVISDFPKVVRGWIHGYERSLKES